MDFLSTTKEEAVRDFRAAGEAVKAALAASSLSPAEREEVLEKIAGAIGGR